MLNRKVVGTFIVMVFAIGWANGAELFANYNGESIGLVRDNDGKTNFLQTIDGAIFPILGQ